MHTAYDERKPQHQLQRQLRPEGIHRRYEEELIPGPGTRVGDPVPVGRPRPARGASAVCVGYAAAKHPMGWVGPLYAALLLRAPAQCATCLYRCVGENLHFPSPYCRAWGRHVTSTAGYLNVIRHQFAQSSRPHSSALSRREILSSRSQWLHIIQDEVVGLAKQ
jgi:hypothetical protein